MKKIYSIFLTVLLSASVFAQVPQGMSYQAVIRDASNNLVKSLPIGMRVSILQGSSSGIAVYVETQTPTTNTNGLVTLEIGSGTPVTGTFAGIDWSTGTYYIKTETDPTGGTNYTITGTSQILSVPYALYAKTVTTNANLSGMVTSVGNVTTVVTNANLTGDVTSVGNATTLTNAAVIGQVLNGYVSGAGTVAATDNILQAIQKLNGNNPMHYIGESYGGGIVFYVYDNGQHGLVAATADQGYTNWYVGVIRNNGIYCDGLGAGTMNTALSLAKQIADNHGGGNNATTICSYYSVTVNGVTYGNWYLPSKYELNLLYLQKSVVGGFVNFTYLSSTENQPNYTWGQDFSNGVQTNNNISGYVRAIRSF